MGESRGRCRESVLLQEFRAPQHGKHVGERLLWLYLASDRTGRHAQLGATAASYLQNKRDCSLPHHWRVPVSHLHMLSFTEQVGLKSEIKQQSKQSGISGLERGKRTHSPPSVVG